MRKEYLEAQCARYRKRIERIESMLANLPEGRLYCCRNGKYFSNFYREAPGKPLRYLPKSDNELAQKLAVREYYENVLKETQDQLAIFTQMLCLLDNTSEPRVLSPQKMALISQFKAKSNANSNTSSSTNSGDGINSKTRSDIDNPSTRQHNPKLDIPPTISTLSGIMMRSKSEVLIANIYTELGLSIVYEPPLQIGGYTFNPDFMAPHPITGIPIYHEHFGMMDDEEYATKTKWKIGKYAAYGYLPFKNIIFTYESESEPLDVMSVRSIIESVFM